MADSLEGLPVKAASGLGFVRRDPALNGRVEAHEIGSRTTCRPVPDIATERMGFVRLDQRGLLSW